jgi:hypothetical protein
MYTKIKIDVIIAYNMLKFEGLITFSFAILKKVPLIVTTAETYIEKKFARCS